MPVNHAALAPTIINLWRRRGPDTLVKVAPIGTRPDPYRAVAYCTTLKYIIGRTPAEMELILGFAPNSKLSGGVDVSTIEPLPRPDEFELRGYSQCPAGLATDDPAYVSHPLYPPGLGAPQWDLAGVSQARLKLLIRVQRGEVFSYDVKRLAPLP